MEGIPIGSLRAKGAFGISQILDFSMKEYPREHSQAILEENGVHRVRLSLASGSILLDMEKKNRSFQDAAMTYGQVISQTLAVSGVAAPRGPAARNGFIIRP